MSRRKRQRPESDQDEPPEITEAFEQIAPRDKNVISEVDAAFDRWLGRERKKPKKP